MFVFWAYVFKKAAIPGNGRLTDKAALRIGYPLEY